MIHFHPSSIVFVSLLTLTCLRAAPLPPNGFVESEQPFLRSSLIVSEEPLNRVRRGILLPLGGNHWVCFDPDLLRYAAIWKTQNAEAPISMDSMAGISYPNGKAKAENPPSLIGETIHQTPELPGVGIDVLPEKDIRTSVISGRGDKLGSLPSDIGKYIGLRQTDEGVLLSYQIGTRLLKESNRLTLGGSVERLVQISPGDQTVVIHLDSSNGKISGSELSKTVTFGEGKTRFLNVIGNSSFQLISDSKRGTYLVVRESKTESEIRVLRSFHDQTNDTINGYVNIDIKNPPFPEKIEVTRSNVEKQKSYLVRNSLPLPEKNPWKRKLRPTDIAFLSNGEALITTLDGDVWRVLNISENTATWSRVACGIFEPMSIAISDKDEAFVLGRDQITKLVDDDKDGFFESYVCASDVFAQTLHTRDYQTSLEIMDDGSFAIGRAGLADGIDNRFNETTTGRGTVLRITPDGTGSEILADGLRLPFIGKRADGQLFASDQQGHFIPTTPIHHIKKDKPYLGFEPANFRKIDNITPPLVWFPYDINRSGASFANLSGKGFPSLGDAFVHLSWSGRIFPVVTPDQGTPFAWKLPDEFDFPILGAATNPKNGKLYATGIGISGYKPQTVNETGLTEINEGAPFAAPISLEIKDDEIIIGFRSPLPSDLNLNVSSVDLELWNIKRTKNYGSGHFRWDGKPGEHSVNADRMNISGDRLKISITTPRMFQSDILRLRLQLPHSSMSVSPYAIEIYAIPQMLQTATEDDLQKVAIRENSSAVALVPGDQKTGETLFKNFGCTGCHSLAGEKLTGPPLNGLVARHKGDIDSYIKTSILNPAAFVAEGYEASMPPYEGVISEQDISHLVEYIRSLK